MNIISPQFDYSFVKKLNNTFYLDLNDLIEAYYGNIQASIFQIANGLFEKGFKYFLNKEGKLNQFFYKDPNLTKMVLSSRYADSKKYIRDRINIDYDVLTYVRDSANSKKHDLVEDSPSLNKSKILNEILSLFVQLNNYYFDDKVDFPSKDYIEYVSSFNDYKEHRFEEELNKRLSQIDIETSNRLDEINKEIKIKEQEKIMLDNKVTSVETKIEEKDKIIKEQERKIKQLDDILANRRNEIAKTESSSSNNDIYELGVRLLNDKNYEDARRVFESLRSNNIMVL